MKSRRRIKILNHEEEPTVNLTPLIDVVFVILIMFILIAPLLEMDRIELANGVSNLLGQPLPVQERSPITIQVQQDNSVWLNERRTNADELVSLLRQAKKKFPQAKPQLIHDRRAFFGTYQAVKNAAEIAGFSQMDIILKPS